MKVEQNDVVWRATRLGYRYPSGDREAIDEATLGVARGEIVALVGPNGSGKSTLIRLLVGAREPARGETQLLGRKLASWGALEIARRVGIMAQHEEPAFPVTVRELVAMGRYPHLGAWRRPGADDHRAIGRALERCRVDTLADRSFVTLSGGERQRARLARALAQEPLALALDEPTAALDIASEMSIWELLRAEAAKGTTVLLSTHNLNLAARYADRLILLHRGRVAAEGAPETVLREPTLSEVYSWPVKVTPHPGPGPDEGAPQVVPLHPESVS
jgi:iron complex transport system ATP-binding protein